MPIAKFFSNLSRLCAVLPHSPSPNLQLELEHFEATASPNQQFQPTNFETSGGDWDISGSDWVDSGVMMPDNTGNDQNGGQQPEQYGNGSGGQQGPPDAPRYPFRHNGPPPPLPQPPPSGQAKKRSKPPDDQGAAAVPLHSIGPDLRVFVEDQNGTLLPVQFNSTTSFHLAKPPPIHHDENTQQRTLANQKPSDTYNDTHSGQLGAFAPTQSSGANSNDRNDGNASYGGTSAGHGGNQGANQSPNPRNRRSKWTKRNLHLLKKNLLLLQKKLFQDLEHN